MPLTTMMDSQSLERFICRLQEGMWRNEFDWCEGLHLDEAWTRLSSLGHKKPMLCFTRALSGSALLSVLKRDRDAFMKLRHGIWLAGSLDPRQLSPEDIYFCDGSNGTQDCIDPETGRVVPRPSYFCLRPSDGIAKYLPLIRAL